MYNHPVELKEIQIFPLGRYNSARTGHFCEQLLQMESVDQNRHKLDGATNPSNTRCVLSL